MISTLSTSTASDIQTDYMKLLITQLQNQNPLEPLDNDEMASQLAQFSQLQQLQTMNNSFSGVLSSVEKNYASSLLGKEVSFLVETETGAIEPQNGIVEQVYYSVDGETSLKIDDKIIGLEEVLSVK